MCQEHPHLQSVGSGDCGLPGLVDSLTAIEEAHVVEGEAGVVAEDEGYEVRGREDEMCCGGWDAGIGGGGGGFGEEGLVWMGAVGWRIALVAPEAICVVLGVRVCSGRYPYVGVGEGRLAWMMGLRMRETFALVSQEAVCVVGVWGGHCGYGCVSGDGCHD